MNRSYTDKEWLQQEYWNNNRSLRSIAAEFKVDAGTIVYWMNSYGIPRRSCGGIKGSVRSQETKDKIRKGVLGRKHTAEAKERMSIAQTGHEVSESTRKNLSLATKRRFATPESRKVQSDRVRGFKHTEEAKKKISDANRRNSARSDVKKKRSTSLRHAWSEGKFTGRKFHICSPTSIEQAVYNGLCLYNIEFKFQYSPEGYSKIYDFLVYPNILIECQGEYWHRLPGAKEKDQEKRMWAINHGFYYIAYWGKEIRELGVPYLLKQSLPPHIFKDTPEQIVA